MAPSPAGDPKGVSSSPSDHDPRLSSSSRKKSDAKGSGSGALSPSAPAAAGQGGCRSFSQLLAGAMACSPALLAAPMLAFPCFLAPAAVLEAAAMTGPFLMSHQAVLATVTAQAQMRLQGGYQPPFFPLSPVPLQQQSLPKPEEKVIATDAAIEKQKQMTNVVKTIASDGYNWRKYGQKPEKQSESLRSYYRCTDASCSAKKKVAHCIDGRVTEIIYHGEHNHACPEKVKFSREADLPCKRPLGESENIDIQTSEPSGSRPDSSKMEQSFGHEVAESLHCSSDSEVADRTEIDKDIGEPDLKRRACENHVVHSPTLCKIAREQKVLVESASNSGLENDGYRWRKYGQKNIKGSPNPRSYYRCTHTGCPARKHVEKASDVSKAMVVTYEGKHNHESELPKSESEMLPAGPPVEAPAAAVEKQVRTLYPDRPSADRPQDTGAAAPTEVPTLKEKVQGSQTYDST